MPASKKIYSTTALATAQFATAAQDDCWQRQGYLHQRFAFGVLGSYLCNKSLSDVLGHDDDMLCVDGAQVGALIASCFLQANFLLPLDNPVMEEALPLPTVLLCRSYKHWRSSVQQ